MHRFVNSIIMCKFILLTVNCSSNLTVRRINHNSNFRIDSPSYEYKDTPGTCEYIDIIYFAQANVLTPDSDYFRLIKDRDALIKVHVLKQKNAPANCKTPQVTATLKHDKDNFKETLTLIGPDVLPESFEKNGVQLFHRYEDSFTATIKGDKVKPGLTIEVNAGEAKRIISLLNIGAPNPFTMTFLNIHYLREDFDTNSFYGEWEEELKSKFPSANIDIRNVPPTFFKTIVMLPNDKEKKGKVAEATRVSSFSEYTEKTGLTLCDGDQHFQWSILSALHKAAGKSRRHGFYYMVNWGLGAGGNGGNMAASSPAGSLSYLMHEPGHGFGLNHAATSKKYPYRGEMLGVQPGKQQVHVGATWGFDPVSRKFLSPITPIDPEFPYNDSPATLKGDGQSGGGRARYGDGLKFGYWSDYHFYKMQMFMEEEIVVWKKNNYFRWNDAEGEYTTPVPNTEEIFYPIEDDVDVYSILVGVSGVTKSANIVYPPIGPFKSGIIKTFNPHNKRQRLKAREHYCPKDGCDVTLKITQKLEGLNGVYTRPRVKVTYAMLDASYIEDESLKYKRSSFFHSAINVPARNGKVIEVELLLTRDAQENGIPDNPEILDSWPDSIYEYVKPPDEDLKHNCLPKDKPAKPFIEPTCEEKFEKLPSEELLKSRGFTVEQYPQSNNKNI